MSKILRNILLVEDEPDIQTIFKVALDQNKTFHVEYADSGKEALAKLESFQPDLILLDMMMPEMNGVQVFYTLKSNPKFKDIPVIFLTARIQQHEVKYYYEIGALDVISKPFDPMALEEKLQTSWAKFTESETTGHHS